MRNSRKKAIILIFLSLIVGGFIIANIQSIKAETTTEIISTVAERDTYVDSDDPNSNYGGKDWFLVGEFLGTQEAYFYFNFSDKPEDWTKAQVSLDIYSVDETMDLTVSVVSNSWDEYEINYANKPEHGEVIGTWQATGDKVYTIEVTDFIDESKNGISICIYTADPVENANCQGHTREGAYSWDETTYPILKWTYTPTKEPDDDGGSGGDDQSDTTIPGFNIALVLVSTLIGLGVKRKRIRSLKK